MNIWPLDYRKYILAENVIAFTHGSIHDHVMNALNVASMQNSNVRFVIFVPNISTTSSHTLQKVIDKNGCSFVSIPSKVIVRQFDFIPKAHCQIHEYFNLINVPFLFSITKSYHEIIHKTIK